MLYDPNVRIRCRGSGMQMKSNCPSHRSRDVGITLSRTVFKLFINNFSELQKTLSLRYQWKWDSISLNPGLEIGGRGEERREKVFTREPFNFTVLPGRLLWVRVYRTTLHPLFISPFVSGTSGRVTTTGSPGIEENNWVVFILGGLPDKFFVSRPSFPSKGYPCLPRRWGPDRCDRTLSESLRIPVPESHLTREYTVVPRGSGVFWDKSSKTPLPFLRCPNTSTASYPLLS